MKLTDVLLGEAASTVEKALQMSSSSQQELFEKPDFIYLYWTWLKGTKEEKYKQLVKDLKNFKSGSWKKVEKLKFTNDKKGEAIKSLEKKKSEIEKELGIEPASQVVSSRPRKSSREKGEKPEWKEYEDDSKEKYAAKSPIPNADIPKTKKESGFTFDGKIDQMVKGIFNQSSFADYLIHSPEVNLLKTDIKIKTTPKVLSNGVTKRHTMIEVKKDNPGNEVKMGEISSIRNRQQWAQYLESTKKVLEQKTKRKYTGEEVNKIAKSNYEKMIASVLKETPQKKNAIVNRMLTHLTPKGSNSFLLVGEPGGEEKIVPFSKKFIDFKVKKGMTRQPFTGAGFKLPRVAIFGTIKPGVKYDGPVVESFNLMLEELLNG